MNENLQRKIALLPDSPGCYLMKEQGKIIYVGKAVNLKNRVRSYFHGRDHTPKVSAMVSHVDDFDILLARSNLEALILECNLIKLHKPYYNILLKDDKNYPYVRIDLAEAFPRVDMARRMEKDGAKYFGPFIGATAVKDVLETLKKVFPLRTCKLPLPLDKKRRPCLNYEIGRCLAPCAGKCTEEEYRTLIKKVMRFLSGDYKGVLDDLKTDMQRLAMEFQYERAAVIRDKIRDIEGLMERQQAVQVSGAEQDVIALSQDSMDAMAQVLLIRGGKMVGGDSFALPGEGRENKDEVLFDFITQYYDERKPPREVLLQDMPEELLSDLAAWLREKRQGACQVLVPKRGDKRALVLLSEKNARDALEKRNAKRQVQHERTVGACQSLQKILGLENYPKRIEGFDISNTQGILSVASMVVFVDGEPARKEYRHYRIKTVEGANDFASMHEVLLRRFKRAVSDYPEERWVMPDLVLIDGGPQQLRFAREAMLEAGADVPMFGLAERLEEIFLPGQEESILLDKHDPALHLIQRIRDEAHRFAITHHRTLRNSTMQKSQLEDIPLIGPGRRRALLARFHSVKKMREATLEELLSVPGMTKNAAENLYAVLHRDDKN
ncbi:MAG: excinuclease ABC subunit UvrC [Clostridiales bacterium]|nr:excinuclease ABC subunit UvrC [Clostridiales bacterium]